MTIFWWIYVGAFPTQTTIYPIQRSILNPQYIYYGQPLLDINDVSAWITLAAIIGYILVIFKNMSVAFIKTRIKLITLLGILILTYAAMVVIARVNMRGIASALGENSYYNYFFWSFFIILLYTLIPFENIKPSSKRLSLKIILVIILISLIGIQANYSYHFMELKADIEFFPRELNNDVKQLIKKHGTEPDFSFGIAEKFLYSTRYLDWIKNYQTHKQGFHFIELLYPQYYVEKYPKFLFYINKEGKWDYWIRKDP